MAESNDLISVIGTLAGVSPPVRTTFIAAVNRLIGGAIAIPAALLQRPARAIEDTTSARSLVSQGLAAALVERAKDDPALMKAVAEAYLPTTIRKSANRIAVAQQAALELESLKVDPDLAKMPDEDWSNVHQRHSEDASSEELQLIFAKILAGEIASPGSYSKASMRVVSELSQTTAQDFEWAWSKSIGDSIWRAPDFRRGEYWSKVSRLRHAGLISPADSGIHENPFSPIPLLGGLSPFVVSSTEKFHITLWRSRPIGQVIPTFSFTEVGMEIGSLVQSPNYRENFQTMANSLKIPGVEKITIGEFNNPEETYWVRTGSE